MWLGGGWYENRQFNGQLEANGIEPIEGGFEYGLVVRHRLSRWASIGMDLMRLEGRTTPSEGVEYAILGSPIVINGYFHPKAPGKVDFAIFGGVGILMNGTVRATTPAATIEAKQLGTYLHVGADAEARIGTNLAFALRGLIRSAKATKIDFRQMTGDPEALFDVDFNGGAIHFGPRWYFGGNSVPQSK